KRIADEASRDPNHHVLAVLGASHEIMADELADTGIETVINSDWQDGMSGSIKIGLRSLLRSYPDLDQCVIAACDQPFIDANVFHGLKILAKETGKGIVTTGFDETWGIPVLFSKQYFDELLSLDGQEGAKRIVKKYGDNMAIFPFEKAKFDIDTKEDYYHLKQSMVSVSEAEEIIHYYLPKSKKNTGVPI